MFYAHFVLSKRGPLARIWLAAHWDKKLTKAHVFETNLESSVESILQPKVKMALRTSGHLLLGVVRIYSRKAKYLLADCNEAFIKIKMAFRPGAVDLPEENREANINTITLPEVFHDFETTMADLAEIDQSDHFALNQSRAEEITMREDLGHLNFPVDNGFGVDDEVGFTGKELPRQALLLSDENAFKIGDGSKGVEQPVGEDMQMDVDKSFPGDGFGGVVGEVMLDDANFINDGGGRLFDDAPIQDMALPTVQPHDTASSIGDDDFGGYESDGESLGIPAIAEDQGDADKTVVEEQETTDQPPVLELQVPVAIDQTVLIPNEEDAFTLEPLDETAIQDADKPKVKRKRKLIIDEIKGIDGDDMRAQLSDTSDIVTTLDLAPPTKKLMHWKETGGVEKLFALPTGVFHSKMISKRFMSNLVTKSMPEEEFEVSGRTEHELELEEPENIARDENLEPSRKRRKAGETPAREDDLEVPRLGTSSLLDASCEPPLLRPANEPSIQGDATPAATEPEQPAKVTDADYDDPYTPGGPVTPCTPGPATPAPEALGDLDETLKVRSPEHEEELLEQLDGENAEQFEERQWNRRSQQMLFALHRCLKQKDEVTFSSFVSGNNRKQVASKFYMMLVLRKQQAINISQEKAYGDIQIARGPSFDALSH